MSLAKPIYVGTKLYLFGLQLSVDCDNYFLNDSCYSSLSALILCNELVLI